MTHNAWRHEFIHANGVRFHYVTAGEGPLVLLLHGFPQCWYTWRHQIPVLAGQFRVVAPDLRGYGESDKPSRVADYRMEHLTADMAGLIEALGEEKAIVVGHDWGGGVAWAMALEYPRIVDRLIILNCPHPGLFMHALRSNVRQLMRSWYMLFFQLPLLPEWAFRAHDGAIIKQLFTGAAIRKDTFSAHDILEYKNALQRPGAMTAALNYYRAASRDFSAMRKWSDTNRKISAPTLLIWAEEDIALG